MLEQMWNTVNEVRQLKVSHEMLLFHEVAFSARSQDLSDWVAWVTKVLVQELSISHSEGVGEGDMPLETIGEDDFLAFEEVSEVTDEVTLQNFMFLPLTWHTL